jgi:hypothetical protein
LIRTAIIVTSLVGAGLEREAYLLKSLLESHEVSVQIVHYTDMSTAIQPADVLFSLEVVMPRALGLAARSFLFPNSEWWHSPNDQFLPRFDKILCKTQDCFEIWSRKIGMDRCAYTSFEARDLYDSSIAREEKFLHVAGRSEYKNTKAVLDCWHEYAGLPPLTVISSNPKFKIIRIPRVIGGGSSVTQFDNVSESQLKYLMNSHKYHIMPSEYEGFGHSLHEAIGCNSVVLTTDAPPMRDYEGICGAGLVPVDSKTPRSLAVLNMVTKDGVLKAVKNTLEWSDYSYRESPRDAFLRNREFFRHLIWNEISS